MRGVIILTVLLFSLVPLSCSSSVPLNSQVITRGFYGYFDDSADSMYGQHVAKACFLFKTFDKKLEISLDTKVPFLETSAPIGVMLYQVDEYFAYEFFEYLQELRTGNYSTFKLAENEFLEYSHTTSNDEFPLGTLYSQQQILIIPERFVTTDDDVELMIVVTLSGVQEIGGDAYYDWDWGELGLQIRGAISEVMYPGIRGLPITKGFYAYFYEADSLYTGNHPAYGCYTVRTYSTYVTVTLNTETKFLDPESRILVYMIRTTRNITIQYFNIHTYSFQTYRNATAWHEEKAVFETGLRETSNYYQLLGGFTLQEGSGELLVSEECISNRTTGRSVDLLLIVAVQGTDQINGNPFYDWDWKGLDLRLRGNVEAIDYNLPKTSYEYMEDWRRFSEVVWGVFLLIITPVLVVFIGSFFILAMRVNFSSKGLQTFFKHRRGGRP